MEETTPYTAARNYAVPHSKIPRLIEPFVA